MSEPTSSHYNNATTKTTQAAILVIDDNFAIREALTDILTFLPEMTVYTAADGQEGLQIFQQQQQHIALVLLDMNMQVMNGEQTYEKLQEIEPEVKVIVSSSLSQAEARLRFRERELPTYLQKPYDLSTLLNVVQTELAMA
jgi:DNA-binding response OmpR family regulator